MKRFDLHQLSSDQLVERFTALALEQDEALRDDEIAVVNKLFHQIEAVEEELKNRAGDQRQMLTILYRHPSAQVRLKAAEATLAVAPEAARMVLQTIKDRGEFPQALDAGMILRELDRGVFKPT